MNDTSDLFFNENIRSVNKVVEILILTCAVVPVAFCILTLCGIWRVPHAYSAVIFFYSVLCFFFAHCLNKFQKTQKFGMYFGIIATAVFVELLAVKELRRVFKRREHSQAFLTGKTVSFDIDFKAFPL